ncbi:amidase [Nocardia seriolae]|uniref:amidase family protein n=1 Tax=Nocardia seriolae TaxID=37332 RepID=UPI0012BB7323|nr:amidase family protein [Nocardia seriolae]MTJ64005.1 amidase [Nocardia seriolae]MTJ71327.1 amidase [Nocardia seriolae]MTJ88566.1 amidase [Nocardia seriolae]MTK32550.1 amidase [Nocardia seriolae]MTK41891.1 amidase [Nocardia seriolae]
MTTSTSASPTALEIAAAVRGGSIAAVDVVRAHLDRIERLDAELNAFQSIRRAGALAEAVALDARTDLAALPLAGVPIAIKDNIAVADCPLRHGSTATSDRPQDHDDPIVSRLRAAGGIIVGTTRMPELAAWAFTASRAFGPTRNPLNPALDPGGSTGGGAAAVAAGMAAIAIGTDGGGSIRVPAASCGLVGFKPTAGLCPLPGGRNEHWFGLTVTGPIARTTADAAVAVAVLAADPDLAEPVPDQPLRMAVSTRTPSPLGRADHRQRRAIDLAATALRAAGHTVGRADRSYPVSLLQDWGARWLAGVAEEAEQLGLDPAALEPRTRAMLRRGNRTRRSGGPRPSTWPARAREWFADTDILLTPVIARGPLAAGALQHRGYLGTYLASARTVPFTQAWNLAGFPAICVPVGTADGRALAVQLVGLPGTDRQLLTTATQLETHMKNAA